MLTNFKWHIQMNCAHFFVFSLLLMQIKKNSKIVCFICIIITKWQGISESLLKAIQLVNLAICSSRKPKPNLTETELN